jgi:hypothetical protein
LVDVFNIQKLELKLDQKTYKGDEFLWVRKVNQGISRVNGTMYVATLNLA